MRREIWHEQQLTRSAFNMRVAASWLTTSLRWPAGSSAALIFAKYCWILLSSAKTAWFCASTPWIFKDAVNMSILAYMNRSQGIHRGTVTYDRYAQKRRDSMAYAAMENSLARSNKGSWEDISLRLPSKGSSASSRPSS